MRSNKADIEKPIQKLFRVLDNWLFRSRTARQNLARRRRYLTVRRLGWPNKTSGMGVLSLMCSTSLGFGYACNLTFGIGLGQQIAIGIIVHVPEAQAGIIRLGPVAIGIIGIGDVAPILAVTWINWPSKSVSIYQRSIRLQTRFTKSPSQISPGRESSN